MAAMVSLAMPAAAGAAMGPSADGLSPDAAKSSGLVPNANAALHGTFQTATGEHLKVVSDDNVDGERTVVAKSAAGDLVRYRIQSTSVTEADRAAMRASLLQPLPKPMYSETRPEPETHRVTAAPLAKNLRWTPVSVVASTDDTVSISWTESKFTAKLSDGSAARSNNGQVVLTNLKPNMAFTAELTATSDEGDGSEYQRERIVQGSTLATGTVSPMTYQEYTTAYVHKAFIQESSVSAVYCGYNSQYTFGGDGRGYHLPSFATPTDPPNYRTMMFANVNWDNTAPYDFVWTKNVGASKLYKNGVLNKTLYASMNDMLVQSVQVGSTYAKAYFNHTARNPLCLWLDASYAGSIRYAEWVEYYRSGTVAIDGYRFKAPRHEMYGRFNTTSGAEIWKTIAQRPNEGFLCLLGNGACGMDFYQNSASY
ncbi:hypothetical protein [Microbacterium terrisoli]|uniref:hypothetical protein n=1 Tax=Microbacterium terrisoli TaxID=3242192 RepID=UPI002804B18F|nr:hypothetical protein [Microbacterium protaetiae]